MGAEVIVTGGSDAVADADRQDQAGGAGANAHAAVSISVAPKAVRGGGGNSPRSTFSSTSRNLRAEAFFDISDDDWTKMFEVNVMSGCAPYPALSEANAGS